MEKRIMLKKNTISGSISAGALHGNRITGFKALIVNLIRGALYSLYSRFNQIVFSILSNLLYFGNRLKNPNLERSMTIC